nr:hypothetical protein [Tanacetum cinerariifolium]
MLALSTKRKEPEFILFIFDKKSYLKLTSEIAGGMISFLWQPLTSLLRLIQKAITRWTSLSEMPMKLRPL